ncbi:MAG: NAD-binding protein [Actinomycetota bacterium]
MDDGRLITSSVLARFRIPVVLLAIAVVYGVAGYMLIDYTFVEALYQTAITLTTVGYREVRPLGTGGQLFTISLLLIGVSAVFAGIAIFAETLARGELGVLLRSRRVQKRIRSLDDHYIICAYGRVGRAAVSEFQRVGVPFVVIDTDERLAPLLEEKGVPYLIADPTDEEILRHVGIDRARGLVCAVDSDTTNVFIALTARSLNPGLTIVARAARPETVDRLQRAGADRVVSPYALSGSRMALLSLRPSVVDFVDMVTVAPDLRLDEIMIHPGSPLDGRTVGDAVNGHPGTVIVALKKPEGRLIPSPAPDTLLQAGDLAVALGPRDVLEGMED